MPSVFYLGQTAMKKCHEVNADSYSNLSSLQVQLGELFAFADVKSISFHTALRDAPLQTIEDVKSTTSPIELRGDKRFPVQEPPGPKPIPYVGNHYELYPDPLGNYDRLFARYGPMIKTVNMGTTVYHTNDPNISRFVLHEGQLFTKTTSDPTHPLYYMNEQEALFTCDSDSPAFAMSHKFIPPALTPRSMAHHAPLVRESARSIFGVLDEMSDKNLAMNVYQYMFKLGGQVIFRVIVNQDTQHFTTMQTPPCLTIRLFGEYLKLMKKMSLRPKWHGSLPFGEPARLRKVRQNLFDEVEKSMRASVTEGGGPLLVSDPSSPLRASCVADYLCRAEDKDGQKLPLDVLLANVVVLMGAGFTTSASLLSWSLYALVKYPGNQERLLQELIDHGADGSKEWTYDALDSMKFLDCFIKETQRMHSPSFQTARNAKRDVILPGGYFIPVGSIVISCFPSIHKNPAHWENPARFDADRWSEAKFWGHKRAQGLYTPFAAGKRGCVGFNLALLEVKMVLAELVYRYHFEDCSQEAVIYDPEFLVVRPLNFYASPQIRTSWPSRSSS